MLGPIDYVVVGFKGNNFDGSVVSELSNAVRQGIIRVIDLVFIMKDENDNVLAGEYEDQPAEIKDVFDDIEYKGEMPLFTESDIAKVAQNMPNDTAAGVLVIEHLWAKGLKKALIDAGGTLIADGRIHPDAVAAAVEDLDKESEA
jgi:hypothetical protein